MKNRCNICVMEIPAGTRWCPACAKTARDRIDKLLRSVLAEPRKAVTVLLILALTLIPAAHAQGPAIHAPEHLSQSVFRQTGNAMQRLHIKQLLGQDTTIDYAIAGANLQIMFAHMDETGYTDRIEQYIIANPSRFIDFPSEPDLQEAFSKVTEDQRRAFVDHIRTKGLRNFHQEIVSLLNLKASALAMQEGVQQGRFLAAAFPQSGPTQGSRQQRLDQSVQAYGSTNCWDWATYVGWAGLYFSVVAFVTGIGAAAFFIGVGIAYIANVYGC